MMRWCFAFVLLLSLLFSLCTSFAADLNGVHFTQGEPHRSLDFRQYFELMTTTQGPCTLSIQSEIFDADQAYALLGTVMEDMELISDATDIAVESFSPFTLYIVKETPIGVERHGNLLYCTIADLQNKNYFSALIDITLDIGEYWKSFGLKNYILNQVPDATLLLSSYYKKPLCYVAKWLL